MAKDENEKVDGNFSFTIQLHVSYISISMMIFLRCSESLSTPPFRFGRHQKQSLWQAKNHIEMCLTFCLVMYESYIFHNLSRQMRR
jgi:hypothetical protein